MTSAEVAIICPELLKQNKSPGKKYSNYFSFPMFEISVVIFLLIGGVDFWGGDVFFHIPDKTTKQKESARTIVQALLFNVETASTESYAICRMGLEYLATFIINSPPNAGKFNIIPVDICWLILIIWLAAYMSKIFMMIFISLNDLKVFH